MLKIKKRIITDDQKLILALAENTNLKQELTEAKEKLSNLEQVDNNLKWYKNAYRNIPTIFYENENSLRSSEIETLANGLETIKLRYQMVKHILDSKISKIDYNIRMLPKY